MTHFSDGKHFNLLLISLHSLLCILLNICYSKLFLRTCEVFIIIIYDENIDDKNAE